MVTLLLENGANALFKDGVNRTPGSMAWDAGLQPVDMKYFCVLKVLDLVVDIHVKFNVVPL